VNKQKYILTAVGFSLALIAFFWNLGELALLADEPIRALVSLEIILHGDWLRPSMYGITYLNKPPLYNWILIGFFKLFGNYSEWVVRLPSILGMFTMAALIFQFFKEELGKSGALMVGAGFLSGGHILFYSSLLGHIDLVYSCVVFLQFMAIFHYWKKGDLNRLFWTSYALTAVGFMMKGLPSLVFQAFTLLAWFGYNKSLRLLFQRQHFTGIIALIAPIGLYLLAFSNYYPIEDFLQNLWSESSKRTVADKSIWQTVQHLFHFPVQLVIDLLPWSTLIVFLRSKSRIRQLADSALFRFVLIILAANILVYWLSPDNRARYLFMLYPFILAILVKAYHREPNVIFTRRYWSLIGLLFLLLGVAIPFIPWFYDFVGDYPSHQFLLFSFCLILTSILIIKSQNRFKPYYLFIYLMLMRIGFDFIVIPERTLTNPQDQEKQQALEMVEIANGSPIALYDNHVNYAMGYYLTAYSNRIIPLKNADSTFSVDSYYLVPTEILNHSMDYMIAYTFVRRYNKTPFSLVKFNQQVPDIKKQ
jgi:4-amino-4-deoxy-L-arabinose transferase-like glycosyltransferase